MWQHFRRIPGSGPAIVGALEASFTFTTQHLWYNGLGTLLGALKTNTTLVTLFLTYLHDSMGPLTFCWGQILLSARMAAQSDGIQVHGVKAVVAAQPRVTEWDGPD